MKVPKLTHRAATDEIMRLTAGMEQATVRRLAVRAARMVMHWPCAPWWEWSEAMLNGTATYAQERAASAATIDTPAGVDNGKVSSAAGFWAASEYHALTSLSIVLWSCVDDGQKWWAALTAEEGVQCQS